ncbi:MAG: hypothetical protein E4H08_09450 [Candidatus Atribacteria bacterium]|nr:MAG: hypothetical protein E4H08_09450 [Candidatus Atribacteria bacterium]
MVMVGHCEERGRATGARFERIRKMGAIIGSAVLLLCLGAVDVCAAYSDIEAGDSFCLTCGAGSIHQVAVGYIRNSLTGESRSVPLHREERSFRIDAEERAVEIQYTANFLLPLERGTYTSSKSRVDPSVSYRLTLTQYYSEIVIDGWPYVSVSKYVGTWERLDSQVAASDGYLSAAAHGWILGGGILRMAKDDIPHFIPGSYSTRTLVPDWAGTYLNFGLLAQHCGEIRVELYRRTDPDYTWEFGFTVCQSSY